MVLFWVLTVNQQRSGRKGFVLPILSREAGAEREGFVLMGTDKKLQCTFEL